MTTLLHERAEEYLRLRRALGFRLEHDGHRLSQFAGYLQQHGASVVTAEHAIAWAQLPQGVTPWTWTQRLTAVRGFAAWLRTIDPATEIPPRGVFPGYGRRPAPFIFTDDDIARMHAACGRLRPWFRSATYTALFGLVAVTGIRIGEALAIPVGGIELDAGLLPVGLPRVSRTGIRWLIHAASWLFRYSSRTSCGVLYPSPEWRRVLLYRSSIHRAISSRAFSRVT